MPCDIFQSFGLEKWGLWDEEVIASGTLSNSLIGQSIGPSPVQKLTAGQPLLEFLASASTKHEISNTLATSSTEAQVFETKTQLFSPPFVPFFPLWLNLFVSQSLG